MCFKERDSLVPFDRKQSKYSIVIGREQVFRLLKTLSLNKVFILQLSIMATDVPDPIIRRMDQALQKYYESVNAVYEINDDDIGLFEAYCNDNDIHDDDLTTELEEDPADCILVEFDERFPLSPPQSDEAIRAQQIFTILKACHEDGGVSNTKYPSFNKQLYDAITPNDVQQIKALYKTQCPAIYNAGMQNDDAFASIAAIGHTHQFDYLQHLVDSFYRDTINEIPTSLNVADWVKKHKHFIELKALSKDYANAMPFDPFQMAKSAVAAFSTRGCPKLMFTNTAEINGCLQTTVQYIVAMIEFVGHRVKKEKGHQASCPFQVDLCLAYGKPGNKERMEMIGGLNEEATSSDDDDFNPDDNNTDEEKRVFEDIIGDIQKKLDANKLKYTVKTNEKEKEPNARLLDEIYNEFRFKLKADESKQYPLKQRWVTFVDGRKTKYGDIWMYTPPDDCRNIPSSAVPEWHVSAAKQCLLPNTNYGKEEHNEKCENKVGSNIRSISHCHGALLTLSIIAREEDVVKAYLYWYGQIIRFEPQDIKTVLPELFNMKWNNGQPLEDEQLSANEQFLDQSNMDNVNQLIQKMKQVMIDRPFQSFVQKYK
eukprot:467139_1